MPNCSIVGIACLTILVTTYALAQSPRFQETEVFVGGHDDISTYRIPSLICTDRGTVLAFCEGRKDNNIDGSPTHLVLKRSLGNAGAWTPAPERGRVTVGRSREWNMTWQPLQILLPSKGGEAYMNQVPVIDRGDGTIFLLVNHHPTYDAATADTVGSHIWLLQSKDEGAAWSEPLDITAQVGTWRRRYRP